MACKKSKQLALQYTLNEEFTNIVKPYQDRIDSLKGVKSSSQETIKINNGEIYNLEKLIEYSVLANALENNPLYKAEIAKKFPTNASSILDNFDRLSKVGLGDLITKAGLDVDKVERLIVNKVAQEVVESKEPIHKLFRNTDLSNISNKNDLSRTDVYKKIGKLKTVQELKNFFKISDPLLKALEQPGKSVKEVFNEYILLRELYGLNDKRVTDIVSKGKKQVTSMPLIVDNTPVKMTSLANEIEAVDKRDLYTFSVLKAQELLGDKQAQEALANRYMNIKNDTTVKSIERNFLERIVDALSKAKNLEDYTRLVDEGIPTSTNPVLKDITGLDDLGNAKYRDDESLLTKTDSTTMLTSVAAEVGVKSRSFPISEIGDDAVINRADQIAEGDTIIVRKSSSKESIIQAVGGKKKFDALNINIVAPAGQNQRNLLVEGNQLYVAFSDEVDYNRYLKRYDLTQDVALVSPEEATKLTREALQLRFDEGQGADKVKAATELVMDFFEPKTFVDATQALEQYVKIGGNMLQTVLDDSALFPRWMQAPFEDVLLYSRNVLRGKGINSTKVLDNINEDFLRNITYDIKYPTSPEQQDELIYQLAEYFGETYNPNNNTLEAFQLWKGINNELGIEVPQLGDITNYIRFLKGEVADSTFIDELLTKNDIKGLSGLERASIEKDVEDYYIANIKNKNYRPLNDYTPASREGERLGYEEIDDAEKGLILEALAVDKVGGFKQIKENFEKDIENYKNIFVRYKEQIQKAGKVSEPTAYKRKLSFQLAVDSAERNLDDKYRGLFGGNRFKTQRDGIRKAMSADDLPAIESRTTRVLSAIDDIQTEGLTKISIKEEAGKTGFDIGMRNGKFALTPQEVFSKEIKKLTPETQKLFKNINFNTILDTDLARALNIAKAIDVVGNGFGSKAMRIYSALGDGVEELYTNYRVIETEIGELPYILANRTEVPGMSYTLDKDLKLDIFTQVSDFMKTKKTLTNDVLDKIVTKSFRKVKADVEHIPAFIEAFKPYQLAFSIPEELMERVPRYVPSAQDADILRKINVEGPEGEKSLFDYLDYLNKNPDESVPRILQERNVFQTPTTEQVQDAVLNLKVYDEYLQKVDNGVKSFDGGISLRAKGALKSIGATKIVKLVETLDTRAEFAATAIEKINKTNQEEVKEIFAYLYGLTNAEFKNYKVERAGSSNLAYSIATYYRLLKNNVYDNAGVGVTKSEAFNQALLQRPASNFVNTVFDSDINRGKIASTVRQSKLFDLAGIKLTNPNAGEFLKGEYNIANREKQAKDGTYVRETIASNLSEVFDGLGANDALRVANGLGGVPITSLLGDGKLSRILRGARRLIPKGLKLIGGYAKLPFTAIGLSQIPGFLIKQEALKKIANAAPDEIEFTMQLMKSLSILQGVGIKSVDDIVDESYKYTDLAIEVRKALGYGDGFMSLEILDNATVREKIVEYAEAIGLSPYNLFDSIFANQSKAIHTLQAIKNNDVNSFYSAKEFYDFIKNPDVDIDYKQSVLESIERKATASFQADAGLTQAGIDRAELKFGFGDSTAGRVAGRTAALFAMPFTYLGGRGDNMFSNIAKALGSTGYMTKYLFENGWSEASKLEVSKRLNNNQDYKNIRAIMGLSAQYAVQLEKRVLGRDDEDEGLGDYIEALKYFAMPLGGLETGSLWKAYSPVFMGILNGKNPIDIYRGNLARGFGEFAIMGNIEEMILKASTGMPLSQAFSETLEKMGNAAARYILDDIQGSYIPPDKLDAFQFMLGNSPSPRKKFYYEQLNEQSLSKEFNLKDFANFQLGGISKALRNSLLLGKIMFLGEDKISPETEKAINNLGGQPKELVKLLPMVLNEDGRINLESLGGRLLVDSIFTEIKTTDQAKLLFDSLGYYARAEGVKDPELAAIFSEVERLKGKEYLLDWKEKLGDIDSDNKSRQEVYDFYSELQGIGSIPGLNAQMLQVAMKYEYDDKIGNLKADLKAYNKSAGLKGKDKLETRGLDEEIFKKQLITNYVREIETLDLERYDELVAQALIYQAPEAVLKKYTTEIESYGKKKRVLNYKWKEVLTHSRDIMVSIADGNTVDLYANKNNVLHKLVSNPTMTNIEKLNQFVKISNFIDYSGLDEQESFNLKSEILLSPSMKSLISDSSVARATLGESEFTDLVEHRYGTYAQGVQLLENLRTSDTDGTTGNGGGGRGKKGSFSKKTAKGEATSIEKLKSNLEGMRKIAKANQKELSRFANIPAPRKPFLFDIKSPNNNPSAINYQGVSSSISDSKSLIQKIVDNEKDIKRIYKPKAIKGPKKKTTKK